MTGLLLNLLLALCLRERKPENSILEYSAYSILDAGHDVLQDGEVGNQLACLECPVDTLIGDDISPQAGDILIQKADTATIRAKNAGDAIEEGCLARTVGSDYPVDTSLLHL